MMVYVCPICCATLHRANCPGKAYCPDCRAAFPLERLTAVCRVVPSGERARALEART